MPEERPQKLERSRSRLVAKSFYRQLRAEGFSHEQILELSAFLVGLVTDDIGAPVAATA